jgi:hypothetical protein
MILADIPSKAKSSILDLPTIKTLRKKIEPLVKSLNKRENSINQSINQAESDKIMINFKLYCCRLYFYLTCFKYNIGVRYTKF